MNAPTAPSETDQLELVPPRPAWWNYSPIVLVALLGLLATWMVYGRIAELEQQRRYSAFSEAARDRLLVIQRELDYTLGLVQDLGGFFDASSHVNRRQFREFVGPTLKRNLEVKALLWAPRVSQDERRGFLTQAQRGFPRFQILEPEDEGERVPASERAVHYPVLLVQPYPENADQLGLDLAADPEVRRLLDQAAAHGGILASAPFPAGDGSDSWLFATYLPVFARAEEPEPGGIGEGEGGETATAERGLLRGFAIGLFRVDALIDIALSSLSPSGVDIYFFASQDEREAFLPFHIHHSRTRPVAPEPNDTGRLPEEAVYEGNIQVGGRTWILLSQPVPGFLQGENWNAWLVLGGGGAFTFMTGIYLFALIGREREVRRLVAQRTLELSHSNTALNIEIVERRRAERALQLLNVTLEQRVARRSAESERRARDLEQFAYVASHDLKAPLRAIANLAQWLKEDLQGKLTLETQEQLDLLRDRVARMSALIEGLLEYSRIGRTGGSLEAVDTAALIAETIDSLAPADGFRVEILPGLPLLLTDRLHLGQVFANLIGNAVHHHDRAQGVVRISARELGEYSEFRIEDDGPGIPPEYREKVFMMFQTLTVKDFRSDTGIGLALVKKLVEEHGGGIHLDDSPLGGCRFTFTWPLREVDSPSGRDDESRKGEDKNTAEPSCPAPPGSARLGAQFLGKAKNRPPGSRRE